MSADSIVVHRTYDPIQAELLGDLMRDAGLAAQVIGTRSGASIGVGQVIMQLYIRVPAEQAGDAIDFLEAYFDGDGAELLRREGLLDDEDDEDGEEASAAADKTTARSPPDQLRPLFAAGSMLLIIGGGHLYARRGFTTLLIAAGQILAIVNMLGGTWRGYVMGVTMFGSLLAFDVIGSQFAVRAHNRGVRQPWFSQLIVGALFVAVAGGIGSFLGPRVAEPKQDRADSLVTRSIVSCTAPASLL